jgi:hypothetical protein
MDIRERPLHHIPFFKKMNWLKRFNFPRVEVAIGKLFIKLFKQYAWLPSRLSLSVADVLKRDRFVAQWYMRPKSYSGDIDPRLFLEALEDTFSGIDLSNTSRLLTVEEYIEKMNKQASSCYPLYRTKADNEAQLTMREFVSSVLEEANNGLGGVLDLLYSQPITVFHRFSPKVKSALKKIETKIRLVFGYPFGILALQEMIHGDTVDRILRGSPFNLGMTRPEMSEAVGRLRRSAMRHKNQLIQMDIDGIDFRLSAANMYLVHAILIESNRLSGVVEDGSSLSLIEDALALYEVRSPVIGSWGSCMLTNGGTKSGTRFNTFANSIVLELATRYHFIRMDYPDRGTLTTIGYSDDKDAECKDTDHVANWRETFELFHLFLHSEKSRIVGTLDEIDFMGMTWNYLNTPDRPLDWVASKLIYPEKYLQFDFKTRLALRATSILTQITSGIPILMKLLENVDVNIEESLRRGERYLLAHTRLGEEQTVPINLPFDVIISQGWRLY